MVGVKVIIENDGAVEEGLSFMGVQAVGPRRLGLTARATQIVPGTTTIVVQNVFNYTINIISFEASPDVVGTPMGWHVLGRYHLAGQSKKSLSTSSR